MSLAGICKRRGDEVKRVKPKRPPASYQGAARELFKSQVSNDIIDSAILLTISCMAVDLKDEEGFGKKRLDRVLNNALALMMEIGDRRNSLFNLIRENEERVGFSIEGMLREYYPKMKLGDKKVRMK